MSRVIRAPISAVRPICGREFDIGGRCAEDPAEALALAREQADRILAQARARADSIVAEAKAAAERIRVEAEQEGFRAGFEDGLAKGISEVEETIARAKEALARANAAFDQMLRESEPKLVALSLEVARRIAGDAVKGDPDAVAAMIRTGFEALRGEKEFTVVVDPSLVAYIEGYKDDLARTYNARKVAVEGDPSVGAGAVVRTPHGTVDLSVNAQIENIACALGRLRQRAGEVDGA